MADEENSVQDKPASEEGLGNAQRKENGVKSPENQVKVSVQEEPTHR